MTRDCDLLWNVCSAELWWQWWSGCGRLGCWAPRRSQPSAFACRSAATPKAQRCASVGSTHGFGWYVAVAWAACPPVLLLLLLLLLFVAAAAVVR
jgi:hypothetical protein